MKLLSSLGATCLFALALASCDRDSDSPSSGTGGVGVEATGGANASGGSVASGGTDASGGTEASGGTDASGGSAGAAASGGEEAVAGGSGKGGASGAAGAAAAGGPGMAGDGGVAGERANGGAGGAGGHSVEGGAGVVTVGGAAGADATAGASGALVGGSAGAGAHNWVSNPGFETDASGWAVLGGTAELIVSNLTAHSGAQSLLTTGRTAVYQGPRYSLLGLTPGATYAVSLWVRLDDGGVTSADLGVILAYECTGGSTYLRRWAPPVTVSPSAWTELTGTAEFPTCSGLVAADLYVEASDATVGFYLDDVVVTDA